MAESNRATFGITRILSAIILLAIAGIHLFLVFDGVGGVLGILFVLNAVAGVVLLVAVLATHGILFKIAMVLSFLFVLASLLALVLALTVGLFGITETWTFTLVPETVIVDALGVVVLAISTAMAFRTARTV